MTGQESTLLPDFVVLAVLKPRVGLMVGLAESEQIPDREKLGHQFPKSERRA